MVAMAFERGIRSLRQRGCRQQNSGDAYDAVFHNVPILEAQQADKRGPSMQARERAQRSFLTDAYGRKPDRSVLCLALHRFKA
jgi:hypothetical protein